MMGFLAPLFILGLSSTPAADVIIREPFVVSAESRDSAVAEEIRQFSPAAESRVYSTTAEERDFIVTEPDRENTVPSTP